ncbi:UNVERIFIED_CONTAM: hypothetical protein HHA_257925 [Hammondia hammondi]|eukprot:XP_008883205.1 hypothetical protein HHA_257925 [Hammondia hammondi]
MKPDAPESPLEDVVFSTASSSSPHSVASASSSRPLGVTSLLKGAMEGDHEKGELLMQSETTPPRAFPRTPSSHNTPSQQTSAEHTGESRRVSRPLQRILRRNGNSTAYRSRALTPIILAVLSACLVSLKLFYFACVRSTIMTLLASTSSSSSSLEFAPLLLPRFPASPFSSDSDVAGSSIRRLADNQGGAPNQGTTRNSELCHTGGGSGEEGLGPRESGENLARIEGTPMHPSSRREPRGQARQELGEEEIDRPVITQGGGSPLGLDEETRRGRKRKISVEDEEDADNAMYADETSSSVLALPEVPMRPTTSDYLYDPYAESNEEELRRLLVEPRDIPDAQDVEDTLRLYARLFDNVLKVTYRHPWCYGTTTVSALNSLLRVFAEAIYWWNKFEELYPQFPPCEDSDLITRVFQMKGRVQSLVRRRLRSVFADGVINLTPQLELQLLRTAVGASRGVHTHLRPIRHVIRELDFSVPVRAEFQRNRFDLRHRLSGRNPIKDLKRWLQQHPDISYSEESLLKAAIRAQDAVDAVQPKDATVQLSLTSQTQSDEQHDVMLFLSSPLPGDQHKALELPWTSGQSFTDDIPPSAASPSSWALAISEQTDLAITRLQRSRSRLKKAPTEASLGAVLAHLATSDLLLGRIASLRQAYPELRSHMLVEQAKSRILEALQTAWSNLQLPMDYGSYRYGNMEEYFEPSDSLASRLIFVTCTKDLQFSSGLTVDESLLLDDLMAIIDEESGSVPGGSSPVYSVPSPPDEQRLLDELIPSLDLQEDTVVCILFIAAWPLSRAFDLTADHR